MGCRIVNPKALWSALRNDDKLKKLRRRAAGAGLSAFTAVSLALGGLFTTPEDLANVEPPPAIVMVQAEECAQAEAPAEEKKTRRSRLRAWVQGLPAAVRIGVLLPLWCLGRVLLLLLGGLWTALSPLMPLLGGFLLNLLLIAGLAALAFKLFFPDRPLRELFCKRNVAAFLLSAALLCLLDYLLPLFFPNYARLSALVKALLTLLIPAGLFLAVRKRIKP